MALTCIMGRGECDGCMDCQEPKTEDVIATCAQCSEPVHSYDDRYELPDGEIVHDDCALDYINRYRVRGE